MSPTTVTFPETFRYWLKLGFISFGGPTGQIAMMHKEIVENREWIPENRFIHALNFCMLLPGPEAQQLATYIGWLLNGKWGGISAGVLFVLPSIFILWGLSWTYVALGGVPSIGAFFYGLKPAVVAIVAEAVLRIGKKSLKGPVLMSVAAVSFIAIYFLNVPFPVIILIAGIIGYFSGTRLIGKETPTSEPVSAGSIHPTEIGGWKRTFQIASLGLLLWFLPNMIVGLWIGWDNIFIDIGMLFSKAAVVTFGGAYAVLGYISQQAVHFYGWLEPEQMMDGLGLAETTPGPLIMVNQFVAYVAAYKHATGMSPALAGALGGLIATWVTFVPSMLLIFIGAPYIEKLRQNRKLSSALSVITAAVVGVVLNLAVLFTYHTLFPETAGFDWYALTASLAAFISMQRFKLSMIPVILASAAAGYVWKILI